VKVDPFSDVDIWCSTIIIPKAWKNSALKTDRPF
jgi:hypothetical protein